MNANIIFDKYLHNKEEKCLKIKLSKITCSNFFYDQICFNKSSPSELLFFREKKLWLKELF